jgi:hypothetical protein
MLRGMAGLNGIALPNAILARLDPPVLDLLRRFGIGSAIGGGSQFVWTYVWITALLGAALLAPNTHQLMTRFEPAHDRFADDPAQAIEPLGAAWLAWRPGAASAVPVAIASILGFLALSSVSEFLYFQF